MVECQPDRSGRDHGVATAKGRGLRIRCGVLGCRAAIFRQRANNAGARAQALVHGERSLSDFRQTTDVPIGADEPIAAEGLNRLSAALGEHYGTDRAFEAFEWRLLRYGEGDAVGPHVDNDDDPRDDEMTRRRVLTAVTFLSMDQEHNGGRLRMYRLSERPTWHDMCVEVVPEFGYTVIFPARIVHEVSPVTSGSRSVLVGWFCWAATPCAA